MLTPNDRWAGEYLSDTWRSLFEDIGWKESDSIQTVSANIDLFYEGEAGGTAFVLCSGLAYSCKRLIDGTRRIIDIHVPGDVLGWSNLVFGVSQVEVRTLTEVRVISVSRPELIKAVSRNQRNAFLLLGDIGRSHALLTEHVVNLGRTASARVATLFLELEARYSKFGSVTRESFDCPIPHGVLADAVGITSVHLSRVLRNLRQAGLLSFSNGVVRIIDRKNLIKLSEFNPAFLRVSDVVTLDETI